jgi:hypothetical protein
MAPSSHLAAVARAHALVAVDGCGEGGDLAPGEVHDVPVVRNLGTSGVSDAPPAVRATTPGWRDPRLWVGVVIVLVSVVAGARLLAAADDTVAVWALASDLGAGDHVEAGDLVATRVRFADDGDLDRYFTADDELPPDLELTRAVSAGELLPRAAVGPAAQTDTVEMPIAVDAEQVPPSVQAGAVVDVYLVPSVPAGPGERAGASEPGPGPALSAVTVVDAPALEETFGTSGKRQLVLAVGDKDARRFFALLGATDSPVISVVRRG